MARAAAAYERAPAQAEEHGVAGERATGQGQLALALAFTDLTGLDLHATTLNTQIAALVRDAVEDRARVLQTQISVPGLIACYVTLELALCFHHAARGTDGHATVDAVCAGCANVVVGP